MRRQFLLLKVQLRRTTKLKQLKTETSSTAKKEDSASTTKKDTTTATTKPTTTKPTTTEKPKKRDIKVKVVLPFYNDEEAKLYLSYKVDGDEEPTPLKFKDPDDSKNKLSYELVKLDGKTTKTYTIEKVKGDVKVYVYLRDFSGKDNIKNNKVTVKSNETEVTITPLTGIGMVNGDDKSFTQGSWEGLKKYAEEKGITYKYYKPAGKDTDSKIDSIYLAISSGAKLIVTPGYLFEPAIYKVQDIYPEINFVLLDGTPQDGTYTDFRIEKNVYAVLYAEEEP